MLLSLGNQQKEHLSLIKNQSTQVLVDFCKLSIDYLNNGLNEQLYFTAAEKLSVPVHEIRNCVYGLVNLLILACQHGLSGDEFRNSIINLGFNENQESVLNDFFQSKKAEIDQFLHHLSISEPHYDNLEWRLEVVLSSRCMLNQVNPILTMDLSLKKKRENYLENDIEHHLLQTDVNNLEHICEELEKALKESRSRHFRKLQRTLTPS